MQGPPPATRSAEPGQQGSGGARGLQRQPAVHLLQRCLRIGLQQQRCHHRGGGVLKGLLRLVELREVAGRRC